MPYRAHAPSAKCLRRLFGAEYPDALISDLGFRNLVATRYISYNSPFLLSGEQKYASCFQDLVDSFNQEPRRSKAYFLNPKIYGKNRFRFLDRLPKVWNASTYPHSLGRSFMAVWRALSLGVDREKKYKIPNVGCLLALQICGKQLGPQCRTGEHKLNVLQGIVLLLIF